MSEESKIIVSDSSVKVLNLEITRKDVADYLRVVKEDERVHAFVKAVEVGVFCLERATASQDTEFVRHQIQSLLNDVEAKVSDIPRRTENALLARIGTEKDQVLAPVQTLIQYVERTAKERIEDVRNLLQQDIDPTKDTSSLGKALKSLRDLLDPRLRDSVQSCLDEAVKRVVAPDGELAKAVREAVSNTIDPLRNKVDELDQEVQARKGAQQIVQQTTLKGPVFEDEVLEHAKNWSRVSGAEISHVGKDNKPGDVLVVMKADALAGEGLRIIIEARDRGEPVSRTPVSDAMASAMETRSATRGIYVCREAAGFGKEIGEWAEGAGDRGAWIACTFDLLSVALRFTIVQQRLAALRSGQPEVDLGSITVQIQRIRTALEKVKNIKTQITKVQDSAQAIKTEAEEMREEIKESLDAIENSTRIRANASVSK